MTNVRRRNNITTFTNMGDYEFKPGASLASGDILFLGGDLTNYFYRQLFLNTMIPIQSTMFSLLAFYIASAAYRAFRARSLLASILLLAALIIMIRFVPLGPLSDFVSSLSSWILKVPNMVATLVLEADIPPLSVIVAIMILEFILGMFMEVASSTLIVVPILFPLVIALGFDPIWFGVLWVVNHETAMITPPVGMNLYVIQGVSKVKFERIVAGAFPYLLLLVVALTLILLCPPIATWLPTMMR